MIIQVQAISKILASKDYGFIENNAFTESEFIGYEPEFNFIKAHYEQYGNVPDEATFLSRFPEFPLEDVTESDTYLIDALRENKLYLDTAQAIQHAADLLKTDSNMAVEYMQTMMQTLQPQYSIHSEDVISNAKERYEHSLDVQQNQAEWFIPTGFEEVDTDINGFQKGDELVVIFARTNMGKSWVAEKIASFMAELGNRVGYFSPEMNSRDIGYRFDTLHAHVSNNAVRLGRFNDEYSISDYEDYIKTLDRLTGKLLVTRPKDFARKCTVTKLKQWIKQDGLDVVFIDGITYLSDERYKKGDSKTISLTNISEDLMDLSAEMRIPIIVVVQANRGGAVDKKSKDTPELEAIRDSDGIAQNASIVYAVRQMKDKGGETYLLLDNKKMRGGEVGKSYKYRWDINYGEFEYVDDIDVDDEEDEPIIKKEKKEPTVSSKRRGSRSNEDDF